MREIEVVNSFKQVGKIKWFGGFNNRTGQRNDYGFVECEEKGDIWVHRTEVYCSEYDLKEGTLVKFELRIYGNSYSARNLHLLNLSEEQDLDIIECVYRLVKETENTSTFLNEFKDIQKITPENDNLQQIAGK